MIKKIFVFSFLISLTACQVLTRTIEVKNQKSLTFGFTDSKINLDWQKEPNLPSLILITNLMEGLVGHVVDGTQLTTVPALAESWEQKEGNTQWTFKLRDSLTWSDGKPLLPENFIFSFKRLLAPETASPYADILFLVKGAKDFHEGKIKDFQEVGIKSPDSRTLIFTLNSASPHFPETMGHFSLYPMRPELLDIFAGTSKRSDQLPWAGAFRTAFMGKRRIQIVENKKYYGLNKNSPSAVGKVDLLFDVKKDKLVKMMKDRKIDGAYNIDEVKIKNTKSIEEPAFEYVELAFNCQQKPLTNPILRRVLALSLNKDELARLTPGATSLGGVIPPGVSGYESNRGMRYDPEMAAMVLKNANMTQDLKKFEYDIYTGNSPQLLPIAEAIRDQLKKGMDMEVKVVQTPFDPTTKRPSMILERRQGRTMDPLYYLGLYDKTAEKARSGWKNREYEEFLKKAQLARAQHLIVEEEIPVVPLFSMANTLVVSNQLSGVKQNFMKYLDLKEVVVEKK